MYSVFKSDEPPYKHRETTPDGIWESLTEDLEKQPIYDELVGGEDDPVKHIVLCSGGRMVGRRYAQEMVKQINQEVENKMKQQQATEFRGSSRYDRKYVLDDGKTYSQEVMVMGIERALKKAGIGRNSKCPCGSGEKTKHCCCKHLRNPKCDLKALMEHLGIGVGQTKEVVNVNVG